MTGTMLQGEGQQQLIGTTGHFERDLRPDPELEHHQAFFYKVSQNNL